MSYCRDTFGPRSCELTVEEIGAGRARALVHSVELGWTVNARIVGAAIELQSHIGPHAVEELDLFDLSFSAKLLIDQIPAARHASIVRLNYAEGSSPSSREYIELTSLFERPLCIELPEIPIEALLVFLQSTCATQLNGWAAYAPPTEKNSELNSTAEDTIFRFFSTLPTRTPMNQGRSGYGTGTFAGTSCYDSLRQVSS